ncbi:MAG TPA: acetyl-CoA carboxylase biotin carboxyl carrier protein [Kofleriaceae bacterium]|nr:acetyl-CoA carboxylase biotin carboxyl carrier protein [Kofleriaceae bacterium]
MPPREKPGKNDRSARSESAGAPEGGRLVAMARGLAEIVAEHGLSELILDTKEVTLTVRRGGTPIAVAAAPLPVAAPVVHVPAALPPAPATAAPAAAAAPAARVDERVHVVTSPFVGTFYRKPNPDSPPYVSLNDRVQKGQVLCIVEAMKLMNEIEADAAGTIVAILVEDNQPVEYGQQLFKIAP